MADTIEPRDQTESQDASISLMPLRNLIERVDYAMSRDKARPNLHGVFLEHDGDTLLAVATDGHRLARASEASFPLELPKGGAILSANGIKGLKAALPRRRTKWPRSLMHGTVHVDEKNLVLEVGGREHRLELADGWFPDYRQIIPDLSDRPTHLHRMRSAQLAELAEVLGKITESHIVRVEIADDGIVLTAEQDVAGGYRSVKGSGRIPACAAKGATFYINARYLAQALHALPGDIEFYPPSDERGLKPITIRHAMTHELALIMPRVI